MGNPFEALLNVHNEGFGIALDSGHLGGSAETRRVGQAWDLDLVFASGFGFDFDLEFVSLEPLR